MVKYASCENCGKEMRIREVSNSQMGYTNHLEDGDSYIAVGDGKGNKDYYCSLKCLKIGVTAKNL